MLTTESENRSVGGSTPPLGTIPFKRLGTASRRAKSFRRSPSQALDAFLFCSGSLSRLFPMRAVECAHGFVSLRARAFISLIKSCEQGIPVVPTRGQRGSRRLHRGGAERYRLTAYLGTTAVAWISTWASSSTSAVTSTTAIAG